MKMVKSLLLGSAAGMVAVAGAQAADLPVKAVAVQYVKICTLYGDGFYYIPGSDTCIKFSGYVRADYGWNNTGSRTPHYSGSAGAQDRTVARHSTRHRGLFASDARTNTPYGVLRTVVVMQLQNENGTESFNISRAYIQWAGFSFGHQALAHENVGSPTRIPDTLHQTQNQNSAANGNNSIYYTWNLGNGVSLAVGGEESRFSSLANLSTNATSVGSDPTSSRHGQSHPQPFAVLTVAQAWGRARVAVIGNNNQATYYTAPCPQASTSQCPHPSDVWGYAVVSGVELQLPFLSQGSRFGAYFNYGVGASQYGGGGNLASPGLFGSGNQVAFGVFTDAVYVNGSSIELTTSWTAGAGLEYFWNPNFSTGVWGNYTEISYNSTVVTNRWFCAGGGAVAQNIVYAAGTSCDPSFKYWTVGVLNNWFPAPGFRLAVEVLYTGINTAAEGQVITLSKAQGARPTGAYTARNLGITSVVFRAQRNWGGED